jgi:hypothetical protein
MPFSNGSHFSLGYKSFAAWLAFFALSWCFPVSTISGICDPLTVSAIFIRIQKKENKEKRTHCVIIFLSEKGVCAKIKI